jgi:hypothetical protein
VEGEDLGFSTRIEAMSRPFSNPLPALSPLCGERVACSAGRGDSWKGKNSRMLTRVGTVIRSSRREEALTSFCTSSLSLLTSAATNARFMEGEDLKLLTRIGAMSRPFRAPLPALSPHGGERVTSSRAEART